ncbi:MAG TPA: hypothetical protein VGK29_10595 [Paludibaculum sp.]|jgi:hypothetical protein
MIIHPFSARGLRLAAWVALAVAGPVAAQDQKAGVEEPAPAAQAVKPAAPEQKGPASSPYITEPKGPFVRKFSMGGSFSFLAQASMPSASLTQTVATDLSIDSQTTAKKRLFGGGILIQTTLTPRLALATGMSFRLLDFGMRAITYEGEDDTTTTLVDERKATMQETTTRARLLDIPVLLRRYNKDHTRRGRRYFYEGGMTLRYVHGIHSFGLTTSQTGTETCCDETSLQPAHRVLPGFVGGAGMQFIDEFGIRFVPEVRYTRWMGRTFDTMPARSRSDQLEFGFSVTF